MSVDKMESSKLIKDEPSIDTWVNFLGNWLALVNDENIDGKGDDGDDDNDVVDCKEDVRSIGWTGWLDEPGKRIKFEGK